ncbi:hypothetical protein HNQ72_004976 [Rhizobium wenxiniae]|uniref:Uncharacterized protein n=1 Tax=Rhizobium wenxiniae TaxID=1737357 RepID=A0A7X0D220_9HYPH|nr:hypothetical protein [Rhizobium wenxiniae]MBB6165130.1 hypothetical protein [Rhizobium wenxiniae]
MFENKFVIQTDNSKADAAAGKLIAAGMALIAGLAAISYAYTTVIGWYHAAGAWMVHAADYLTSFWPF